MKRALEESSSGALFYWEKRENAFGSFSKKSTIKTSQVVADHLAGNGAISWDQR
jgi:hypothetical protein